MVLLNASSYVHHAMVLVVLEPGKRPGAMAKLGQLSQILELPVARNKAPVKSSIRESSPSFATAPGVRSDSTKRSLRAKPNPALGVSTGALSQLHLNKSAWGIR